jgi:hypothetical protein
MLRHLLLLASLVSIEPALGALYEDMASLPTDKDYDYIIVGGKHVSNVTY